MKPFTLLILMGLLCSSLNAQYKIAGKITDNHGAALPGAAIAAIDMNKGTVSGADGSFKLENLPNGKHKLQIAFLGYASKVETVEILNADANVVVPLTPSVIETEEIVVTGGSSSTQHENAVKIEMLKIKQNELKATPNFMQMLTHMPGVDMISKGNGVSKPVIRGLSMNDILVLNNSVRFENYQYSSHHPLGIDEFGLESVEVIKGPASILYGSDAIGGVLNFIKERPAPIGTLVGDYNLQLFSNSLGTTQNIGLKGAKGNLFGGIRAGLKSNADYLQGGGDYVPNSRFNEQSLKANAGITGKIGSFKLYYDYNSQNLGLVEDEAIESIAERGRKLDLFYQKLNTHLLSSQNRLYLGKSKLEVNTALQHTTLSHMGDPNQVELEMGLNTLTYDAKLFLPSNKNAEYIVGVQGMEQTNRNIHNRETILLPNAQTGNFALMALAQNSLSESVNLQAGLRYDVKKMESERVGALGDDGYRAPIDKSYNSLSGSIGSTFRITPRLLLRANVATGFRTPNLAELTANGPHEAIYETGDNSLVPERSVEYDLSSHYHVDNVTIDVAGFYNQVGHFIFIAPTGNHTPNGLPIYQYQQSNSVLKGGEIGFHYHPKQVDWLHLVATYALVVGTQQNGDYLPFIPSQKLNVELKAERKKCGAMNDCFAMLSPSVAFDQNHAAPDETTTPGYVLWDFSVGGRLHIHQQPIDISLAVNNLFDKKYIDHLSTLKEVGLFNPGRDVALTVKVPFGSR